MIITGSKTYRRSRLNLSSALSFDGAATKKVVPAIDGRLNFGTKGFSFSFFFDYNGESSFAFQLYNTTYTIDFQASTQGSFFFRIKNAQDVSTQIAKSLEGSNYMNAKYHITCDFDGIDYRLYINAIESDKKPTAVPNGSVWDLGDATTFTIGNRINGSDSLNGVLSNFCIFNRSLTQKEISFIHVNGGILPKSVHEAVVAHYPLQTAYFDGVNNMTPDVVEQYNYAKPNYSVPALSTWTIAAGYSVTNEQLTYDGTQGGTRAALVNIVNLSTTDIDRWIKVRFNIVSNPGQFWVYIGGTTDDSYRIPFTGTGIRELYFYYEDGGEKLIFVNYANSDSSHIGDVWTIDQVEIIPYLMANHGVLVNYTKDELGLGVDYTTQTAFKHFFNKGNVQDNIFQLPVKAIYEDNIEIESGLNPVTKALQFDDTLNRYLLSLDTFSIPYHENGQYTIQVVFKSYNNPWRGQGDDDFVFGFYNATATSFFYTQLRPDSLTVAIKDTTEGQKTTNILTDTVLFPSTQLNTLTILMDNAAQGFGGRFGAASASESSQLFLNGFLQDTEKSSALSKLNWSEYIDSKSTFAHNAFRSTSKPGFNGALVSMLVWDTALEDIEILKMSNNILLKNPSIPQQKNLQFHLDFQNPIDNAGVVEFRDKINNHAFREKGFGNITAVNNELIDINSLR